MKKVTLIILIGIVLLSMMACGNHGKANSGQVNNGQTNTNDNIQNGNGMQADSSYDLDTLIAAVKKAGLISGEPEKLDVTENGAQRAEAYGNIAFLAFDPSASNAYFSAYDAGEVTIKGKTVKIGAINGPYMMVFLDGTADQKAIDAFLSVGYSR